MKSLREKNSHWIGGAIKHPGALRAELNVPKGKKIPVTALKNAAKDGDPKLKKRALLALTLRKL